MNALLRSLASLRLALLLLLGVALLSAAGTVIPQGLEAAEYETRYPGAARLLLAAGLDHYYTGLPFRALLTLLCANLLACAAGRSADGWRNFLGRGRPAVAVPLVDRAVAAAALRAAGFRVSTEDPLRAHRRGWAFLGFPLVHLAPVAVLAGGLWGSLEGFVGTRNVYVGGETRVFDDLAAGVERELPFRLRVESFARDEYRALQVQVRTPEGTTLLDAAEVLVGAEADVPGVGRRVRIESFDPISGDLTYGVTDRDGRRLGPFSRGQEAGAPVLVRPLAYRSLGDRRPRARVALLDEGGQRLAEAEVSVNRPLDHGGLRLYLTAWGGQDAEGRPYIGFQITRDPGQPLVWAAAVAFSVGLFALLFGNGCWVREEEGRLTGRSSRGRSGLQVLEELRDLGRRPDPSGEDPSNGAASEARLPKSCPPGEP